MDMSDSGARVSLFNPDEAQGAYDSEFTLQVRSTGAVARLWEGSILRIGCARLKAEAQPKPGGGSMRKLSRLLTTLTALILCVPSQAQLDEILKKAEQTLQKTNVPKSNLSNDKIIAGLKEALQVSTGKAVALTGRPDGFLKNDVIKILLPEKLRTVGKAMRVMGMGAQVDDLETGMNRAAEQATPKAKAIFLDAVKRMTFDDARKILSGSDTAATEYFRQQSSGELTAAFTPIVQNSMDKVGVVKQYNQVMKNPMASGALAGQVDINKYVVGKTLDGLFYMLGEEEKKIRKNPAAQTTALLREVFGKK
jgi:hypothetical protein